MLKKMKRATYCCARYQGWFLFLFVDLAFNLNKNLKMLKPFSGTNF